MDTRKLYYEDCHAVTFSANVLSCSETDGHFAVVLDKTLFYPEGGGQPADLGIISGAKVLDVKETNGEILHFTDKPLTVGSEVNGKIDRKRRFSFMQNHTGEHIVSGIIHKLYGLDNVGFHIGSDFMTIDINGELTPSDLEHIEKLSNKAVYENIKVSASFPKPCELEKIPYRSKKALSGDIRIVTVPDYDMCACCGIHCDTTGEVGLIKIVTAQKYKSGMRLFMLCGEKAEDDYCLKNKQAYEISALLSVKTVELTEGVKKLISENLELKTRLNAFKFDHILRRAEETEITDRTILFEDNMAPDDLRKLCSMLLERTENGEIIAIFSLVSGIEYKYAVGSKEADVRELGKKMNASLNGRGGGQRQLIQGSVFASHELISQFLSV